jgi:hypothetical protein
MKLSVKVIRLQAVVIKEQGYVLTDRVFSRTLRTRILAYRAAPGRLTLSRCIVHIVPITLASSLKGVI